MIAERNGLPALYLDVVGAAQLPGHGIEGHAARPWDAHDVGLSWDRDKALVVGLIWRGGFGRLRRRRVASGLLQENSHENNAD